MVKLTQNTVTVLLSIHVEAAELTLSFTLHYKKTCQFRLYEIKKCIVPFSLDFPTLYN